MNVRRLLILAPLAFGATVMGGGAGEEGQRPPVADAETVDRFIADLAREQAAREDEARLAGPDRAEMAAKADRQESMLRGILR